MIRDEHQLEQIHYKVEVSQKWWKTEMVQQANNSSSCDTLHIFEGHS